MLKFIGKSGTDGQFVIGVPARDLTDADLQTYADEIKAFGGVSALVASGLYFEPDKIATRKPIETKPIEEK